MQKTRNIKLLIQYDGTRYKGWQRQKNSASTIQGKIETVLGRMTGEEITIIGSGRTDAGVHAYEQTANFHSDWKGSPAQLLEYCGLYLPEDIVIFSAAEADSRFHSRYNVKRKTYCYRIWNSRFHDVFERKYSWHIPEPLHIGRMTEAAELFTGRKDFQSFTTLKPGKKSTEREIYRMNIEKKGSLIEMTFTADGFLYNMIRIITGTLTDIGSGVLDTDQIPRIFREKERAAAGPKAPPHGLFLVKAEY